MRSYEAARTYFSILGIISWAVIGLGGIVALIAVAAVGEMSSSFGGSPMAGLAGIVPGLWVMFGGFMGLVVVQIGRAGVDTAEYTQQMLQIARDQLEVSRQALLDPNAPPSSFAESVAKTREAAAGFDTLPQEVEADSSASLDDNYLTGADRTTDYKGTKIGKFGMVFRIGQEVFTSLEEAKQSVDKLLAEKDLVAITELKPEHTEQ